MAAVDDVDVMMLGCSFRLTSFLKKSLRAPTKKGTCFCLWRVFYNRNYPMIELQYIFSRCSAARKKSHMSVPPPPAPRKFVSKFPPAQSPTAPTPAPQPAMQKPPAFVPPPSSSSSSPAPPPAGWTTSKASEVASPTSSIMKKKSPALGPSPANPLSFAPASLASSIASNGGSLSPTAQSEQLLKQQLMIEELVRENRNLQGRVARWLQSSEGELADDAERQRAAGQARRKSAAAAATHLHRTEGQDAGDSEEPPIVAGTPNAASASSALGGGGGYETVAVGALTEVLDEKSSPALLVARIRRLELALQLEAMERDDAETKVHVHQRMIAYLLKRLHQAQQ